MFCLPADELVLVYLLVIKRDAEYQQNADYLFLLRSAHSGKSSLLSSLQPTLNP
jgi:hypothetical protein